MKEVVMMALPLKNKFFDFFLIFLLDDDYGKCARSVGKLILIRWEESRWDNDDHQDPYWYNDGEHIDHNFDTNSHHQFYMGVIKNKKRAHIT